MNPERDTRVYDARPSPQTRAARALFAAALLACLCSAAYAQDAAPTPRDDAAPPPMRYLPNAERAQLSAARDLKARTKLSIELADARLSSADAHVAADRFDAATLDLGVYEALVKDAIAALQQSGKITNKTRDLFKRVELALRAHVPRLETLRRSLPSQHAVHAQATLDFVRDARTDALQAFFDDTVIPDRGNRPLKPSEGDSAKGTKTEPEKKPNQR